MWAAGCPVQAGGPKFVSTRTRSNAEVDFEELRRALRKLARVDSEHLEVLKVVLP